MGLRGIGWAIGFKRKYVSNSIVGERICLSILGGAQAPFLLGFCGDLFCIRLFVGITHNPLNTPIKIEPFIYL